MINAQMSGVLLDEEAAGLKQKFFEKFQLKFEEAVVNFESLGGISAENRSSPNDKCNYQEFDKHILFQVLQVCSCVNIKIKIPEMVILGPKIFEHCSMSSCENTIDA